MNKTLRKGLQARQLLDATGKDIKCPRCGYDYHRVIGIYRQTGIDPQNLELECAKCEMPFYVFSEAKDTLGR